MFTVIGSLAAIVAVALDAPSFKEGWEASVEVIVPNVTVNVSAVSESWSSVVVIAMSCVDPAAEFAANVTVPVVAARSDS